MVGNKIPDCRRRAALVTYYKNSDTIGWIKRCRGNKTINSSAMFHSIMCAVATHSPTEPITPKMYISIFFAGYPATCCHLYGYCLVHITRGNNFLFFKFSPVDPGDKPV